MFLGVIAVTILYLTVVLNFAIDGRLDQFFMILVKGLERILSAPIDFVVIAGVRMDSPIYRCLTSSAVPGVPCYIKSGFFFRPIFGK